MDFILELISISFLTGLAQGGGVCSMTCGPALFTYTATECKQGWKSGIYAGLLFNAPRILLLTIIGAALGYVSGFLLEPWVEFSLINLYFIGYLVIGVYVTLLGVSIYWRGRACKRSWTQRLAERLTRMTSNNAAVLLSMGLLMGMACSLEVTLLSALMISAAAGMFGIAAGTSTMLTGAAAMFMFGVGSALPLIVITFAGGALSTNLRNMDDIKSIAGIALIVIGVLMIWSKLPPILVILSQM